MKVLLDECVTRYLLNDLKSHNASMVDVAGLKGLKNGKLLAAATGQFDVLITVDQNLRFQQNLNTLTVAVVLLSAPRSTYKMLQPLVPRLLDVLSKIKPGEVVIVD